MTTGTLDKQSVLAWKADPVTKAVFKALTEIRHNINMSLTNADIITGDKEMLLRLLGQREGLDAILELTIEEIAEDAIDVQD